MLGQRPFAPCDLPDCSCQVHGRNGSILISTQTKNCRRNSGRHRAGRHTHGERTPISENRNLWYCVRQPRRLHPPVLFLKLRYSRSHRLATLAVPFPVSPSPPPQHPAAPGAGSARSRSRRCAASPSQVLPGRAGCLCRRSPGAARCHGKRESRAPSLAAGATLHALLLA